MMSTRDAVVRHLEDRATDLYVHPGPSLMYVVSEMLHRLLRLLSIGYTPSPDVLHVLTSDRHVVRRSRDVSGGDTRGHTA